jgi:hypothetical protein
MTIINIIPPEDSASTGGNYDHSDVVWSFRNINTIKQQGNS